LPILTQHAYKPLNIDDPPAKKGKQKRRNVKANDPKKVKIKKKKKQKNSFQK
jgi:hypothetical protein